MIQSTAFDENQKRGSKGFTMRLKFSPIGFGLLLLGILSFGVLAYVKVPLLDILGALLLFSGLLAPVIEEAFRERKRRVVLPKRVARPVNRTWETRSRPEEMLSRLPIIVCKIAFEFAYVTPPDERHRLLQHISQLVNYLPEGILRRLAAESMRDEDPRIRGEMCYALGRSGRPRFKSMLQPLLNDPHRWVRQQAAKALKMLDEAAPKVPIAPKVIPPDYGDLGWGAYIETIPPIPSYADLQHLMNRLAEEMTVLRKELAEALTCLPSQPDEYARHVVEEMRRNQEAYERVEPELLKKHAGQFAVFCDGELIAVGPDRKEVTLKAIQEKPTARPYIRRVGEKIPAIPAGRR